MNTKTAILIVSLALAPAYVMAQTMYKCVQDGKTIYQSEPCPATAKQDALKLQSNAPAPASTPKSRDGAARRGIPTLELKELPPLQPLPYCCKRKDGSISP